MFSLNLIGGVMMALGQLTSSDKTFMCWPEGPFSLQMKIGLTKYMRYDTKSPDVVLVSQDPARMRGIFPKKATIIWVVNDPNAVKTAKKRRGVKVIVYDSATILEDVKKVVWPVYASLCR